MKGFSIFIVLLVIVVFLSGCITTNPNSISNSGAIKKIGEQNASLQTYNPDGLKSVVDANNQVTSNLLVNISEDDDLIGKTKEKNVSIQTRNPDGLKSVVDANNQVTSNLSVNISEDNDLIGKTKEKYVSIQTRNPDGLKSVVEANNQFASNLYVNISKNNEIIGKNIFFSPFSISSALAPVYEGSRGSTADEIQTVLSLPSNDTLRRNGFSILFDKINFRESNRNLIVTNAIWAEKTYPFLPQYEQIVQEYYHSNVTNFDFMHKSEGSRETINQWVLNQTNNTISDLIPAGGINPLTRLVIILDAIIYC